MAIHVPKTTATTCMCRDGRMQAKHVLQRLTPVNPSLHLFWGFYLLQHIVQRMMSERLEQALLNHIKVHEEHVVYCGIYNNDNNAALTIIPSTTCPRMSAQPSLHEHYTNTIQMSPSLYLFNDNVWLFALPYILLHRIFILCQMQPPLYRSCSEFGTPGMYKTESDK